ncbi:MAG: exodeoxyribonuclease I, partial [Parahaliea sp.]
LARLLYTRADDLPAGQSRPGCNSVHLNRCPLLVTAKMASPEVAARIGLDGDICRANLAALRAQREADPQALSSQSFPFDDARLPEMLFRYRARNFPASLSPAERAQWEEFRFQCLTEPEAGASLCMEQYQAEIPHLLAAGDLTADQQQVLQDLLDYGDVLLG